MSKPRIKLTVEINDCPIDMMESLANISRNGEVLTGAQFAEALDALKKQFFLTSWDHQIGPTGSSLVINFHEVLN